MSAAELLAATATLHRQGRLDEAELGYLGILIQNPEQAHALQLLGVIAYQRGDNAVALKLIGYAATAVPTVAEYFNNLGLVLQRLHRLEEAAKAFSRATQLSPSYVDAHYNAGNCHRDAGEPAAAIQAFRRALELEPYHDRAHNNLGILLADTGDFQGSARHLADAVALTPTNPEFRNNLGATLRRLGRRQEALAAFRAACDIKPDFAEAKSNLGVLLLEVGQLDEALDTCQTAIRSNPLYAAGHANLGAVLLAMGRLDDAVASLSEALRLSPQHAETLNSLGSARFWQGELDLAERCFCDALVQAPDHHRALNNLGNVYKEQGRLDEALTAFRRAIQIAPTDVAPHDNLILAMHYHPAYTARDIAAEHAAWEARHAASLKPVDTPHISEPDKARKLRIGFVSADFRAHAVARFLLPLFESFDRNAFEFHCFSDVLHPDSMTRRLQSCVQGWQSITGMTDQTAADTIRSAHIDILIDLSAHTGGNRLLVFARKPAPIQATWLAYAGSSGLSAMDYRLTDPYLDPYGTDESVYSERCIRLPETYWCYSPPEESRSSDSEITPVPASIRLGCLNNFCKINPYLIERWIQILQSCPSTRLTLHAHRGRHRDRMLAKFTDAGIASERILFLERLPLAGYLAAYLSIDLALDTYPYGGGTTTCDALWMGVPVVTWAGETAVSRAGTSLLSNLRLTELIARTPEDYVAIAVELCRDRSRLAAYRQTLRNRMRESPLLDGKRFAENMGAALRAMWLNGSGSLS